MEIVLATRNKHKVQEIAAILKDSCITIVSLDNFPETPEVVEDGATLQENAAKKAREVAGFVHRWTLADDTGLEVDHLHGEPGVYSARWAGTGCTYEDNNRKMLAAMLGVPDQQRTARFRCVIALSSPDGEVEWVEGKIEGRIATEARGSNGFGYDPIFFVPEYGKTFAELDSATKNKISHRGCALEEARRLIARHLK